ncbi:hypothetical protein [Sphingobium sp. S6]|uniref:hypothetical protein n=1 Tax=Sphingobium sp. S6 TaxID=2758386 RepID=UPI001F2BBD9A|nr:hypothetical protein [Sphingobium sp. S6]
MAATAKAEAEKESSSENLVTALIAALTRKADQAPLSLADVAALTPADRQHLVRAIIRHNQDWFDAPDESGSKGCERLEGESDEDLLARAWRAHVESFRQKLTGMLGRTTERMRVKLSPSLAANIGSSQRLSELLRNIAAQPHEHAIGPVPEPLKLPDIPLHPALKTNDILADVAEKIEQMRDVATATAEMQRSLNDLASEAVADFSAGAEDTRKATQNGLKIAGASLFVSIIALIVSIYLGYKQNTESAERDKAAAQQLDRLIASEKALAGGMGGLTAEMRHIRTKATAETITSSKDLNSSGRKPAAAAKSPSLQGKPGR